ncbi:SRPBCC family protein [Candidatus Poribacteria bacterium]|nr:SRPBCC family protein [Candidatus Poribacteria bacterium]MYF57360.1 SRPBCC family protein [Candidatus Poribacteria bacterium]
MKTFTLSTELLIEKPIDEVFSYFSDAHNLVEITPPKMKLVVLTPTPIEMQIGTLIDYRLKLKGIPIRWQSEITEWNPPHKFVDEQRKGPYRAWIHTHIFHEVEQGTIVKDRVEYAVLGGQIVDKLLVRPDLQKIFEYRSKRLQEILR